MRNYQALIAENGDPGNGMHTLGMQKTGELGQVMNRRMMRPRQRMVKRYIDGPVAVLHIEDHRVAPQLAPAPDNTQSAVACRHHSGQIYRAHFKVTGHRNGFFHDRRVQDSRNDYLLPGFQKHRTWLSI